MGQAAGGGGLASGGREVAGRGGAGRVRGIRRIWHSGGFHQAGTKWVRELNSGGGGAVWKRLTVGYKLG